MGVLEELKQQGSRQREAAAPAAPREDDTRARVDTALTRLYAYFEELRAHLDAAAPDISVDYVVHEDTRLTGLAQGDYKLGTHEPGCVDRFTFHFTCKGPARREMRITGRDLATAQRDRLRQVDLRFETRDLAAGGKAFVLEGFVPVALDFRRDDERGVVRLVVRNLAVLGTLTYNLSPDRVDDELLDQLARAVLRKPHRLAELTGHDVSDAVRMRLRVQLAEEQQQREKEIAEREAQGKRRGLFGRRLFGG